MSIKKDYEKAIGDYTEAIRLNSNEFSAYWYRGLAFFYKQEYDKAIKDFNRAIRLNPSSPVAYCSRGAARVQKMEYEKAIGDYTEAIRLDPKYGLAYSNRGSVWYAKKEYDKAIKDFSEVIRLAPNDARSLNALAWRFATCPDDKYRNGKRALDLAKQACELSQWNDLFLFESLAAAYAETGDFEKAVEHQKKALADSKLAKDKDVQARLKLYENKQPYRE